MKSTRNIFPFILLILPINLVFAKTEGTSPSGTKMFQIRRQQINNVEMPVTNYGEFGMSMEHTAGCYWPKGTGQPHIFGAGIWIGAVKDGDTLVSCGYNTVGSGCDFCPGPPDSQHMMDHFFDPQSHPEDRVYLSTDSLDLAEWPLRDLLGEPIILSDEDGWCEYHDLVSEFHQWEPGTYPLGLYINQHSLSWTYFLFKDMIFISYTIENLSEDTIRDMYVGTGSDMDVGYADNDLAGCEIDSGLGYTFTLEHEDGWSSPPPYYVGIVHLRGPKADDTIYVAADPSTPGYPYTISDTIYPGEYLPLTSFTKCTRSFDAKTEIERYMMLAGYNIMTGIFDPWQWWWTEGPDDQRMVMGCGPFELAPGEVDTFIIGILFSNGSTGGLDYLKSQTYWAKLISGGGFMTHEVQVVSPNGGEELLGLHSVEWTAVSATGNPLSVNIDVSPDSCKTWLTVAANEENDGTYLWDTDAIPDGFYFLQIAACDTLTMAYGWDVSDSEFVVNNPGNGYPQVRVISPNGGEILSSICDVTWYARDPDGDTLLIDLYYSNDGGVHFVLIDSYQQNDGIYAWDTGTVPNGNNCLIKIVASDDSSSSFDISDWKFSVQNPHTPLEITHISGECNTVTITPYVIRPEEVKGHEYEVRFNSIQLDTSHPENVSYGYDVYDITDNVMVLEGCLLSVRLDSTTTFEYSPLFDGLSLEFETTIDENTFNPDSIKVIQEVGEHTYEGTLQAVGFFSSGEAGNKWAFHGSGELELRWDWYHGSYDSLTCKVFDITNGEVEIPFDTIFGDNWCFGPPRPWIQTPKEYIAPASIELDIWFYISGVQYYFNGGTLMDHASPPDSGDVWTAYNSGDIPPVPGNIYRFQTIGINEFKNKFVSTSYSLFQNSPNPFHTTTVIGYRLSVIGNQCSPNTEHRTPITLKIYDASGRLVRTFQITQSPNISITKVVWNGKDNRGKKVASGVYFYRLETDDFTSTKKMIVLR